MLAKGIVAAAKETKLKIPLVVRMSGTNNDIGKKILEEFTQSNKQIKIVMAENLGDAAEKAANLIKQ